MRAQWLAAALLVVCLWMPSRAQDTSTGSLHISLVDASGAAILHARVGITPLSTGPERAVSPLGDGVFTAELLPPADYQVTVESEGMGRQCRSVQVSGGCEL